MSNYVKSTNFASKDSLASGNPLKIVKGTEINTEFDNIATAIATKLDSASATISGATIINSTGEFTTLSANGAVTLSGATTISNLVRPVIDNIKLGYATTATAAETTTLTIASPHQQFFTGSTTQTVVLPVTSTLVLGLGYTITNKSTGVVTVQSSGLNTIIDIPSQASVTFTCILTSGTTAASWSYSFDGSANIPYKNFTTISASVSANALTVTLSPCTLDFRSSTLASGAVLTRSVPTAISMTVSNGSTLGTTNAVQSRLAVIAIDNAGTVELAVVNSLVYGVLNEEILISTTAEGGVGGADSGSVIYSTSARTTVAFRVVGYIYSTQSTAGAWATSPSNISVSGAQDAVNAVNAATATKLSTASGSAPSYSARAWVNFDGTKDTTGTVSTANTDRLIKASGNVSSVTRTATGQYTVNFTTAMPDTNYAVSIDVSTSHHGSGAFVHSATPGGDPVTQTTSALSVGFSSDSGSFLDASSMFVTIFR